VGIGTSSPDPASYGGSIVTQESLTGAPRYQFSFKNDSVGDGSAVGAIDFFAGSSSQTRIGLILGAASGTSEDQGMLQFYTKPSGSIAERMRIDADGNVGIGATPGTLLELFGTAPYLTLRNSTHEDGDGGRESKIIFEGEQSGSEDSTLAVIQASHDGASDDEKGDLIFSTNDGSDGASPTEAMRIDSAGLVGIGTDNPLTKIHSYISDPTSAAAPQLPDDCGLLIDDTDAPNIQFRGSATSVARIFFGDTDADAGSIGYSHNLNTLAFRVNAQSAMTVESDGDITAEAGNLVIGTAGKGIDFSAQTTTTASDTSVDAELLDHYEEGRFTAVLEDGAGNAATTVNIPSTLNASYVRIGSVVHINGFLNINSVSAFASGNCKITGLPFVIGTGSSGWAYSYLTGGFGFGYASGLSLSAAGGVFGLTENNTSYIPLYVSDSTSSYTALAYDEIGDSSQLIWSTTYTTATA
jgi:hypothetical protein